jgi:hypothetical protein
MIVGERLGGGIERERLPLAQGEQPGCLVDFRSRQHDRCNRTVARHTATIHAVSEFVRDWE